MASLLDDRPQQRKPILFGRALAAQQQAEVAAEREDRMAAKDIAQERHNARLAQLQERRQSLEELKVDAKIQAANLALDKESQVLKQFSTAAKALGKLNPKADDYDAQVGQIVADNAEVFADKDNNFTAILKENMGAIQKQRDTFLEGRAKEDNYALQFEAENGVKVPRNEAGRPMIADARALLNQANTQYAQETGMVPSTVDIGGGVKMKAVDPITNPAKERDFAAGERDAWSRILKSATDPSVQKMAQDRIKTYDGRISQFDSQLRGTQPAIPDSTTPTERPPLDSIFAKKPTQK